jgi:hypothetical protein
MKHAHYLLDRHHRFFRNAAIRSTACIRFSSEFA